MGGLVAGLVSYALLGIMIAMTACCVPRRGLQTARWVLIAAGLLWPLTVALGMLWWARSTRAIQLEEPPTEVRGSLAGAQEGHQPRTASR